MKIILYALSIVGLAVTAACGTQQPTPIIIVVTATSAPVSPITSTVAPAPVQEVPTATPTVPAPTATAAPASDLPPAILVDSPVNCLAGPSANVFKTADVITPGKTILIIGKYTDASNGVWYQVAPSGIYCWVPDSSASQKVGNFDNIPKVKPPNFGG